jgi:hypothetical protein
MLEKNTDIIRRKIYQAKDKLFFSILLGCCWFVVGVTYLFSKKSNAAVYLPFIFITFFLSLFLITFLLEKRALDKYPLHSPSRFISLAYPYRSFEGGITILIASCVIIILVLGFFPFFSYRMYKRKYLF